MFLPSFLQMILSLQPSAAAKVGDCVHMSFVLLTALLSVEHNSWCLALLLRANTFNTFWQRFYFQQTTKGM